MNSEPNDLSPRGVFTQVATAVPPGVACEHRHHR